MLNPKKNLGQHFLFHEPILDKIIDALALTDMDIILEVGSGPGYLTKKIAPFVNQLHAIEIDQRNQNFLNSLQLKYPQMTPYYEDFLKINMDRFSEVNKACGNLPYHLSMPIIEKIIFQLYPQRCVFLLAEGTALRFMAKSNQEHYSAASVFVQSFYKVMKVCKVSKNLFHPAPKIDSIICLFEKKDVDMKEMKNFNDFVHPLFSYRRKTMDNALKFLKKGTNYPEIQKKVEQYSMEELYAIYQQSHELS